MEWVESKYKLNGITLLRYENTISQFLSTVKPPYDLSKINEYLIKKTIHGRNVPVYYVMKKFIDFYFKKEEKAEIKKGLILPRIKKDLKKERIYYDNDTLRKIIIALEGDGNKVIGILQSYLGLRTVDIIKLTLNNLTAVIEEGECAIKIVGIGKNNKKYISFMIGHEDQEILIHFINETIKNEETIDDHIVFNYSRNKNVSRSVSYLTNYAYYYKALKQALQSLSLEHDKFACHDFRRCYARRVWENSNKDIEMLKTAMNHSRIETSMAYLSHSGMTRFNIAKLMKERDKK